MPPFLGIPSNKFLKHIRREGNAESPSGYECYYRDYSDYYFDSIKTDFPPIEADSELDHENQIIESFYELVMETETYDIPKMINVHWNYAHSNGININDFMSYIASLLEGLSRKLEEMERHEYLYTGKKGKDYKWISDLQHWKVTVESNKSRILNYLSEIKQKPGPKSKKYKDITELIKIPVNEWENLLVALEKEKGWVQRTKNGWKWIGEKNELTWFWWYLSHNNLIGPASTREYSHAFSQYFYLDISEKNFSKKKIKDSGTTPESVLDEFLFLKS